MAEVYQRFGDLGLARCHEHAATFRALAVMSANADIEKRLARMLHKAPKDEAKPWYSITNKASDGGKKTAEILIYDEIDPFWGVSAGDFANELNALEADEIVVGINSPGGIVFDGIAIMNALKRHPAKVIARIDGLAASAASFIAMAGDEIQTSKYAEMMIHEARGVVMGTADDFKEMRDLLIRHNESIASVYADRAGGDVKDWLKLMKNETWFTADEMVAAGLADSIIEPADESSAADEADSLKNRFDLTVFNFAGRRTAPAPEIRNQVRNDRPRKDADMATLKEQLAEKYGLDPELDDDAFAAAVEAALPAEAPAAPAAAEADAQQLAAFAEANGLAVVNLDQWASTVAAAQQGATAFASMQRQNDEGVVDGAIRAGKIRPVDRDQYLGLMEVDREKTTAILDAMAPGFIPVQEVGHGMNPDPGASMSAPNDLAWFDAAPLEPASGQAND